MPKFTDNEGREWSIALNLTLAGQLKTDLGLDVLELVKQDENAAQKFFARLDDDLLLCGATLYACCAKQAEKRDLTPEQFGEGLGGDSHEAAVRAFQRAIADFMRRPGVRRALHKVIDTTETYYEKADELTAQNLDLVEIEAQKQLARLGDKFGALREQSGLTPEDSLTVS